jgi:prolipoprotein diacylglyceryltransferase
MIFSFQFWRFLKNEGIDDERIFNLTFFATVSAFILSRMAFVAVHWRDFGTDILRMAALWVAPGMTFFGAFIGGASTMFILSKKSKLRIGLLLDALAASFPLACVIASVGAFLDGSLIGKKADLFWAVSYVGHVGRRHPVELYLATLFFAIMVVNISISRIKRLRTVRIGTRGIWMFIMLGVGWFAIELFRENAIYFAGITLNQWISLAILSEGLGALYVRGGGREWMSRIQKGALDTVGTVRATLSGKIHKKT